MSLFEASVSDRLRPLAERLRPKSVEEVIGQDHVIGPNKPIGKILGSGKLLNLIITGPPGTGKTSFAKALAKTAKASYIAMNAVDAGVKDLKSAGEEGKRRLSEHSEKTLLFVDEIHRFNKGQQDVLLPFVERGELYLIGATTEHPSYELNRALLSRCQVINFKRLEKESFQKLSLRMAEAEEVQINALVMPEAFDHLVALADGDGRKFFNFFENVISLYKIDKNDFPLSMEMLKEVVGNPVMAYDKSSDQHYDCISAFIKSVRGSDADAALYYMARMLAGGEDPVYIARRLVILASEDIGNAEPRALPLAIAGLQATELIGLPECAINLSHVVTFLASCPKSNRSYTAWNKAKAYVEQTGSPELPDALKSANKGSGDYIYPQETEKGWVDQNHWPPKLKPQHFYEPSARGYEKIITDYLKWLKN